jgi:hypothetical protein
MERVRAIGGPCTTASHEAMKRDPAVFARLTIYIGIQPGYGLPDVALFNCRRCRSTISLPVPDRFEERAASGFAS